VLDGHPAEGVLVELREADDLEPGAGHVEQVVEHGLMTNSVFLL